MISPIADGPNAAPTGQEPSDETVRMTRFGARDQIKVGGKPKYLGLILTAVLVLFLAVIAAWATFFSSGGLSDLFGEHPAPVAVRQRDALFSRVVSVLHYLPLCSPCRASRRACTPGMHPTSSRVAYSRILSGHGTATLAHERC